ncbi:hypothetical protein IEO21_07076 [Rhodonia placenta]|uniref:Uncharacterized protein n=1 Tax=Rhodonia placenta TaxID=104341 RepID=A0A8H7NZ66_9APHY|nr:hypothetical protein IEO21_07076 [Postia placenta]
MLKFKARNKKMY